MGVIRGFRKVIFDGEGLGFRGLFVWGVSAGGRLVLGIFRWAREWVSFRFRGRGGFNLFEDNFREFVVISGSVLEGLVGGIVRSGVFLGRGEWLFLGVVGGV